ncbi:MAG TPA: 3-isopropylmalate dehydratase small subunit [Myxococcaceae bacterium]|nr:3-isopropylmalate dehydratase small subunit [Myxococcaceae bacterium]
MEPLRRLVSRTVVLPSNDVDTDQIIPARFLKVTDKRGLGKQLFADWRYEKDGTPRPDFVLNKPEAQGAQVLVAGDNFGCGSSREHAPWALVDFGFRAVVSSSIADIFRNNAVKNGLLPVVVDARMHRRLLEAPGATVTVDLEAQTLTLGGESARFEVDPFARHCLIQGVDELGFLLGQHAAIRAFEEKAH